MPGRSISARRMGEIRNSYTPLIEIFSKLGTESFIWKIVLKKKLSEVGGSSHGCSFILQDKVSIKDIVVRIAGEIWIYCRL